MEMMTRHTRSKTVRGKMISTHRGFGFVSPEEDFLEDIFIPARYSAGALRGDTVEVLYKKKGRSEKLEGRVIRILEKGKKGILGLYKERWGQPFFLPFDSPSSEEIPLSSGKDHSLQPGMIVEIDRDTMSLKEILGFPDDPGVDTRAVIQRFGLATSFSKKALEEAREISSKIVHQEKKSRVDYRNWLTVTIDGESAQDFDDAVSVKKITNGNFLLGVHIADVSHYIEPGTSLDKEAYMRETSVYFPDLTLPMLPEKLSNDVCSLRPREERLTFSVLLEIDNKGIVLKADFHPSLIRTEARMTYDSVFKIFEGDEEERTSFSGLIPDLMLMRDLAGLLREKRVKAGSLDFDFVEPELVYREGSLHSVVPFERNEAHQVIEEFMLAANEAVATFLIKKGSPLLFRIHPPPSVERMTNLREILGHLGISLPFRDKVKSKDLQYALKQVAGKPEEKFVMIQVLRSLKLAVYSDENVGHFGLAKKEYTHFTSPIRRYPDLVIHRILKEVLKKEKTKEFPFSYVANHCSEQERNADEAERYLLEWRILRFLKTKLGDELEGITVGISRAGLVVELEDYFVDGIIPFSDLGGDYFFKKSENILIGKRTGKTFELGDRMKVILASVDPFLRRTTLGLVK